MFEQKRKKKLVGNHLRDLWLIQTNDLTVKIPPLIATTLDWLLIDRSTIWEVCFLRQIWRKVTTEVTNPPYVHYYQVVCCGQIRSSLTGTGWLHGSTWQRSGLTGHHGSSCFWRRLTEFLTTSLSRPSMRGTNSYWQTQFHHFRLLFRSTRSTGFLYELTQLLSLFYFLTFFFPVICYWWHDISRLGLLLNHKMAISDKV